MRLWAKRRRRPGLMALRFVGESGMQLACVARSPDGHVRLERCEYHPVARDAESMRRFRRSARLDDYECSALLNTGEYQVVQSEAPAVKPEELREAVRWRVKDLLEFPAAEATVDVLPIPASGGRTPTLYAVAARNALLAERIALFEDAGIDVRIIDVPEMAQRNIAASVDAERGVGVLYFGEDGGMLTLVHGGELYYARHLDITAGQLQDANEDLRRQNLDRVTLDLQRSLDHFDRQFNSVPIASLLVGPLPAAAELARLLSENLYVPVSPLDLSKFIDASGVPELADAESQNRYFHVIGAALRLDEAAA